MSWSAVGRLGNRSAGYARSLAEADAAGSGARIYRVTKRCASVRCGEPNRASERSLGHRQKRLGDGWRWPRDGCSGRDIAAHIGGHRRDVSSRRPSLVETVAGAKQRRSWVRRGASSFRGSGAPHSGRPAGGPRRTCHEKPYAVPLWAGSSCPASGPSGCDRARDLRRAPHNGHGDEPDLLVPGVQHTEETNLSTEVSGIASDFEESFRAGTKQEIVDHLFVLQHHWGQVAGECEDNV